jgi:hypothetical protein
MRISFTAGSCTILMVMLALAPRQAAAGPPQYDPFERAHAPSLVLGMSSDQVRRLDLEFEDDLRALDAFGGKRRVNGLSRALERRGAWTFYGRLGLLNFQNQLDPQQGASNMRFTWRRTGPRLTGRIYVGIHRKF